jgi:hypothetical protein
MEDSRWPISNNDLVTVMKTTTRTIKSKEGKGSGEGYEEDLISDDATSRQVWLLTSGNWRTTGKLIDREKYTL